MTLSEDVLRDLLLELGVEGVTLWHIRALAAYQHNRAHWNGRRPSPNNRMESDLRGEEAVLADAYAQWSLEMQPHNYDEAFEEVFGSTPAGWDEDGPRW